MTKQVLNALWDKILSLFPTKTQVSTALSYKYEKPNTGIPRSDLAEDITTSKIIYDKEQKSLFFTEENANHYDLQIK